MPVENEKRIDAKTKEPEIYKGGAWQTDWESLKAVSNIYTRVEDQAVPDTNYNTYAVDLPVLEVGDKFTVVMARGALIYNLIGRFIGFGFEHEFIFDGIVWRVEIVGTQLRIEAFSGGGSQAVKAIFIER